MKDRFGFAASNAGLASAQARVSGDSEIQSMMDLVSRANLLEHSEGNLRHAGLVSGPITGPADVDGDNIFDKAFGEQSAAPGPAHGGSVDSIVEGRDAMNTSQFLSPMPSEHVIPGGRGPKSAPASRRVSLKRTYTDLGSVSLQNKLSEAMSQPYSATELTSSNAPSSSSTSFGSNPTVHTHSSKWTPVAQAVFTTEAKPGWTILAANDLACLVFGVTQSEVRRLSIMDLVQEERRAWLESKLKDPVSESPMKQEVPRKESGGPVPINPQSLGLMGNGVTAQLLSKPPSRQQANRRSLTEIGDRGSSYGQAGRRPQSPDQKSNKSRGVLLCGDVVPIQKRNGSTGSASLWVMEKRGGLIWVVEEVVENSARLVFNDSGKLTETQGDLTNIWGKKIVEPGIALNDLLRDVTITHSENLGDDSITQATALRYHTALASGNTNVPVTVRQLSSPNELRVSHFPHVAGMVVVAPSTLDIISANPVFSATLFGHKRPQGLHITNLLSDFDEYLDILTEEDNIPLIDGMVIPEHSFRRARALSVLKDGKSNVASLFLRPSGLPALHRDGSEIMVDVQMRIVKSESIFPNNLQRGPGHYKLGEDGDGKILAVTEVVYALWITYSRQLHSMLERNSPHVLPSESPVLQSPDEQTPTSLSPSRTPIQLDTSSTESNTQRSLLTQQLHEAATEPLTDKPTQPMPEVNPTQSKSEALTKKTISDYAIIEDMGQGAYGQVKLARCKRNPSKKVVLKYVTKKRILVDTWTRDRRLGTVPLEIHVLDYLRRDGLRHPNIVQMEDFFEDDINYYIEMLPHGLPGMDLFDYIELRSNMDENECRTIFRQVIDAIHHLHVKALVVHRDIKDENVVLDGEGRIKLIDFGSATYIKNGPFDVFVGTIGKPV